MDKVKDEGSCSTANAQIATGRIRMYGHVWISLMSFLSLFTLIGSIGFKITIKVGVLVSTLAEKSVLLMSRRTLEPQSPSIVSPILDTDLSCIMQKISKLEVKVNSLQSKSVTLLNDMEKVLDAAVCRVDALESELISTKKVRIYVQLFT